MEHKVSTEGRKDYGKTGIETLRAVSKTEKSKRRGRERERERETESK